MARKLWAIFLRDIQMAASYRLGFLLQFTAPLFLIVSFFFVGRLLRDANIAGLDRYGGEYFPFALVGIVFAMFTGLALSSVVNTVRMGQVTGTLEVVLTTQTSLPTFLLGSALYGLLRSVIILVGYFTIGGVLLGVSFAGANIPGALLILVLSTLAILGVGVFSGGFILIFKQGDPFSMALTSAAFLLSGVVYPVAVLPSWLQIGSALLPHTYALEGLRMTLLQGVPISQIASEIGILAVMASVLLPMGVITFLYAIRRARVEGSFGQF